MRFVEPTDDPRQGRPRSFQALGRFGHAVKCGGIRLAVSRSPQPDSYTCDISLALRVPQDQSPETSEGYGCGRFGLAVTDSARQRLAMYSDSA
jgi:hypothetical protein